MCASQILSLLPSPILLLPPPPPPPPLMGCGMSRYGVADHLGFQPIRKKLEDLRKNDRITVTPDDTPSTKLLLKDHEDHTISHTDKSHQSISSPGEESLKDADCDSAIRKNGGEGKVNEIKPRNENVVIAGRGADDGNKDGEKEESDFDEEEERVSDYDASALWIGSPSFREYCTHDSESEDSFKDGGNSDIGEEEESKIKGDKSNSFPNSSEIAMTKTTSKGRKGRRFRKVFPKGKPAAMKNLLHVTSCYNPSNTSAARDHKLAKPIEKTI